MDIQLTDGVEFKSCTLQNGDAAVSNPGSAYGASALGPSASGASAATPANPVAQAGTQPEPKPIQPLQNGTLRNEEEEQGTLQNGQGKQETLEDGEEEAEVKKEQSGASQRALAGLGLPFDPVALTFKDIHYFVKNPNQRSQELELLKACKNLQKLI